MIYVGIVNFQKKNSFWKNTKLREKLSSHFSSSWCSLIFYGKSISIYLRGIFIKFGPQRLELKMHDPFLWAWEAKNRPKWPKWPILGSFFYQFREVSCQKMDEPLKLMYQTNTYCKKNHKKRKLIFSHFFRFWNFSQFLKYGPKYKIFGLFYLYFCPSTIKNAHLNR